MLARVLPTRLAYTLAGLCGSAVYYLWPRGRQAARANMRRVLNGAPPEVVSRVARRSLANYLRYVVDFLLLPSLTPDEIRKLVPPSPLLTLPERLGAKGHGIIVALTHSGNWDLGGAAAAAHGLRLAVVAEGFENPALEREVLGARERLGMRVLRMERPGPGLVRLIRSGWSLAVLVDRPVESDEGVEVRFFGEKARVPEGVARLSLMTGAPIVPVSFIRGDPRRLGGRFMVEEAVFPVQTGDRDADIGRLTQAVMEAHERLIRRYPEQWYMFRFMWGREAEAPARERLPSAALP